MADQPLKKFIPDAVQRQVTAMFLSRLSEGLIAKKTRLKLSEVKARIAQIELELEAMTEYLTDPKVIKKEQLKLVQISQRSQRILMGVVRFKRRKKLANFVQDLIQVQSESRFQNEILKEWGKQVSKDAGDEEHRRNIEKAVQESLEEMRESNSRALVGEPLSDEDSKSLKLAMEDDIGSSVLLDGGDDDADDVLDLEY